MCVNSVLQGDIINTLSRTCFVDKMVICLHFYLQTINIKWLFAIIYLEINKLYENGLAC